MQQRREKGSGGKTVAAGGGSCDVTSGQAGLGLEAGKPTCAAQVNTRMQDSGMSGQTWPTGAGVCAASSAFAQGQEEPQAKRIRQYNDSEQVTA